MPHLRFDWQDHIKRVEGEFRAARLAVDRLKELVQKAPDVVGDDHQFRGHLRDADRNLEGTFLVRIFAVFEAALRSFDQAKHNDPDRLERASVLIDVTSGRRGQGISTAVREGAHEVRRARNFWAHEVQSLRVELTIAEARARLTKYLSCFLNRGGRLAARHARRRR
jgi:hypothetical protein